MAAELPKNIEEAARRRNFRGGGKASEDLHVISFFSVTETAVSVRDRAFDGAFT